MLRQRKRNKPGANTRCVASAQRVLPYRHLQMSFAYVLPPKHLESIVDRFGAEAERVDGKVLIAPDGCVDIIVKFSDRQEDEPFVFGATEALTERKSILRRPSSGCACKPPWRQHSFGRADAIYSTKLSV